jgi:hypothetical protein
LRAVWTPSEQLSAICRRLGLRVVGLTLEALDGAGPAGTFDAVAIWNTFDQLPWPRGAPAPRSGCCAREGS